MTGAYDDIIDQSRHVSTTRFHMAAIDRAAQFSPFAALSGYGDAIKETASGRMTKAEKLGHVEFVLTYKDFNYGKTNCH